MARPTTHGRAEPADRDGKDLAALYRHYAPWLKRRLGTRKLPHGTEVEDVVQEAYLRAARYDGDQPVRHPKALLLSIALNFVRDQSRRQRARQAPSAANDQGLPDEPWQGPDQEYLIALKQIVLELPSDLRDVFLLSRFTRMTYDDIARHLGLSVKTVEWRMGKALAYCARRLGD